MLPCQESSFSPANKTVMVGTDDFLSALEQAPSSPKELIIDCKHILSIMKAESARLDDLSSSLAQLEIMKKTPNQSLGFLFCSLWVMCYLCYYSISYGYS